MGNCLSLKCCSEQQITISPPGGLQTNKKEEPKISLSQPKIPIQLKLKPKIPINEKKEDFPSYDPYYTQELTSNNFEELKKFTFEGIITKARIVDIYDGDTVTLVFYHSDDPIKDSFRLFGYDAPEMKPSKLMKNRDLHIKAAKIARTKLEQLILNQIVWVKFTHEEKYGRLMGELFFISETNTHHFNGNEMSVNNWMMSKGLGKAYDGGSKAEFTKKELIKIINSK